MQLGDYIYGAWSGNLICWNFKTFNYKYISAVTNSHTLHFTAECTTSFRSAMSSQVVAR